MKIYRLLLVFLPLSLSLPLHAAGAPKTMRLASLEWPPYVGVILPQDGLSTKITAAASKISGYKVSAYYFGWTEAMEKGEKDPNFAGYFPEYYSEERAKNCHLSAPIGKSILGLATLKNEAIHWQALSDLAKFKIGVVDGYSNGEAFDKLVKQGRQAVETSASDTANLRKLIDKKVRAIAIDRDVLRYTLSESPFRGNIAFNSPPLAELTLHVCFKRTPEGREMQQALDAGLQKIDMRKLEGDYFKLFETRAK